MMSKYCALIMTGTMLLAINAWAGESPYRNKVDGIPAGDVIAARTGASTFYVSDTDNTMGFTTPLTLQLGDSKQRVGTHVLIQNRGTKATTISVQNTNLDAPKELLPQSLVKFEWDGKKWIDQGTTLFSAPLPSGAAPSGPVNVPPVSN